MTAKGPRSESLAQYPQPKGRPLQKVLPRLEKHSIRFLELSPFCVIATADAEGDPDASPRGGAPGFVKVLDDKTVLFPDRPGNNRLDSLGNLTENNRVSLLCMIPGVNETLRLKGVGEIVTDPNLLEKFKENNSLPRSVLKISLDSVFLHCAKAFMRSALWEAEAKQDRSVLPTMGQMIKDQASLDDEVESQEEMERRYRKAL